MYICTYIHIYIHTATSWGEAYTLCINTIKKCVSSALLHLLAQLKSLNSFLGLLNAEAAEASKSWGAAWLLKFEKFPKYCSIWGSDYYIRVFRALPLKFQSWEGSSPLSTPFHQ